MQSQRDKAGQDYWDQNWDKTDYPAPFNPEDSSLDNTFYVRSHEYFQSYLGSKKGLKILEIGCAHSVWPLYFQTYYDAQVDGLDYSDIGCQKTRKMWEHYGVKGQIFCADMFNPPKELLGQYDLVVSFGVIEHFENDRSGFIRSYGFFKAIGAIVYYDSEYVRLGRFVTKDF